MYRWVVDTRWNREAAFLKNEHMLAHPVAGFVDAILDRVAYPGKAFEFDRIETEELGIIGRFDDELS